MFSLVLLTLTTLFIQILCQQVVVNTTRGPLFGFHFDQGNDTSKLYYGQADIFLGIPFVQPPIGSLRYAKPQRLNKLPHIPYNATNYGPQCPQTTMNNDKSEDCLYLNIYTPNASSTTKYPVMFYIHGGGFFEVNNRINLEGTIRNFVSKGIVVVSTQYRLGFLGFFTTLTDDFPPNLGLLDQIEALKFVKEEISNFGGDPNKVTIWGHSAGSASVSAHRYSPLSQDLFQQSIQESGTVYTCYDGTLGRTEQNFRFAKQACNITADIWNSGNYSSLKTCLMNINVSDGLLSENNVFGINEMFSIGNQVCWNMVQDNNFFPDVPRNLYKNQPSKPMIIGTCKDEWASWEMFRINGKQLTFTNYTKNYVESYIADKYANFLGNQTQIAIKLFENLYLEQNTSDNDNLAWFKFLVNLGTSFFFTAGAAKEVEFQLWKNNSDVFLYEFTYAPSYQVPDYHPAQHSCEYNYVFMVDMVENKINETDRNLIDFFGEAWSNFVKYGSPKSNDIWQATTSDELINMEYLEINPNREMKTGYRTLDRVQFNQIIPLLVGVLPQEMPDYNNGSIVPTNTLPTRITDAPTSQAITSTQHHNSVPNSHRLDVWLYLFIICIMLNV